MTQLRLRREWVLLDTVLHYLLKCLKRLRLWWRISRWLLAAHGGGKLCGGIHNYHFPNLIRMGGCHHGSISSTHGMPDHDRRAEAQGRNKTGDIADRGFWGIVSIRRPRGIPVPTLIQRQHVVSVSHGLAKGVPGVRVALKTVQQDERGIPWTAPLDVVELQTIYGDKFILS